MIVEQVLDELRSEYRRKSETILRLRSALNLITVACEADCGVPSDDDGDDESVAHTQEQHGPIKGSVLTFGMLRKAREALEHPDSKRL